MFIGGCAGSTTGGIKIFRLLLLFRGAKIQIKKLTQPHGVFITSFNGRSVNDDTYNSIMGFFFIYILICILASISLSFFNLDFLTAFSASASAISNVDLAWEILLASRNIAPSIVKWILSFTMLRKVRVIYFFSNIICYFLEKINTTIYIGSYDL